MRVAAVYEQKDLRVFAVGIRHPGHDEAQRVLTAGGLVDRPNPLGFRLPDRGEEAWRLLMAYPGLDLAWRRNVSARLVKPVITAGKRTWTAIAHPDTEQDAVALAEAPQAMQQAEAHVRELYARLRPFGGGDCPRIQWRALDNPLGMSEAADRSALQVASSLAAFALGWHPYRDRLDAAAQAMHPWSGTLHGTYAWAAADYGDLLVFDEVRTRRLVTVPSPSSTPFPPALVGISLADFESPWESLLAINLLGFQVNVAAADQVVLAVR
jgi:hypothetical protein